MQDSIEIFIHVKQYLFNTSRIYGSNSIIDMLLSIKIIKGNAKTLHSLIKETTLLKRSTGNKLMWWNKSARETFKIKSLLFMKLVRMWKTFLRTFWMNLNVKTLNIKNLTKSHLINKCTRSITNHQRLHPCHPSISQWYTWV